VTNALVVTPRLSALEDVVARAGVDFARQALLAADLEKLGYRVRPPHYRGGRLGIFLPDGRRVSLARILRLSRLERLADATCSACGQAIRVRRPWRTLGVGSRGSRVDRHYCSNACRQRAYRRRGPHGQAHVVVRLRQAERIAREIGHDSIGVRISELLEDAR
jgi:hypothetical protein